MNSCTNIYDLFNKFADKNGRIPHANLLKILEQTNCNPMLARIHKVIYEQQRSAATFKPLNKHATPSTRGEFIDLDGFIYDTPIYERPRAFRDHSKLDPHKYYSERYDSKLKFKLFDSREPVYKFFNNRQIDVVWINENSIPKLIGNTICLDQRSENIALINSLMPNTLTLRAIPLNSPDPNIRLFDIYYLSTKKNIHRKIATITGEKSLGLGKSITGSKFSSRYNLAKSVTSALTGA